MHRSARVSGKRMFFFSSRRRHTRWTGDWSSDVCSSDLALSRTFPVGEKRTIQLRAEAFNLPNHLNPDIRPTNRSFNSALFGIADTDLSGILGQISGTTSGDYRVIQLALKFVF